MTQYKIAVLVGSLRKESFNQQLATALTKMAPTDFTLTPIKIDDLPLYNQDHDSRQADPVTRMKREVKGSHGLLFATPEYNRSIPGVLKNAIDHGSRPYGDSAWGGKPAGIVGVSVGAAGTAMAQQHLRNILAYLDVTVLGQPEVFLHERPGFFDPKGDLAPDSKVFLQSWMDRFAGWVRQHAS